MEGEQTGTDTENIIGIHSDVALKCWVGIAQLHLPLSLSHFVFFCGSGKLPQAKKDPTHSPVSYPLLLPSLVPVCCTFSPVQSNQSLLSQALPFWASAKQNK